MAVLDKEERGGGSVELDKISSTFCPWLHLLFPFLDIDFFWLKKSIT
jgi:hypothetical protein